MTTSERRLGRRSLLAGGGAALVAASSAGFVQPAGAVGDEKSPQPDPGGAKPAPKTGLPTVRSAPRPIPGGVDSGDPNVGFIHWWLPGPEDKATPTLGIPGFGLDVDPSTITDFKGVSACAVVAGHARGTDGVLYDCEFDVRAMKGRYVGEDGVERYGAFAFL